MSMDNEIKDHWMHAITFFVLLAIVMNHCGRVTPQMQATQTIYEHAAHKAAQDSIDYDYTIEME